MIKKYLYIIVFISNLVIPSILAASDYTYDKSHRLIKVEYNSGQVINYSYDNAGNLLSVKPLKEEILYTPSLALSISSEQGNFSINESIKFQITPKGYPPNITIKSYEWDFDNNGGIDKTTTDNTVHYSFTNAGSYPINVTAIDSTNKRTSITQLLIISPEPTFSKSKLYIRLQNNSLSEGHKTKLFINFDNIVTYPREIQLSTNLDNTINIPKTITYGTNFIEATVDISAIDNTLVDGKRAVTITASSDNANNSPQIELIVVDNEIAPIDTVPPIITLNGSSTIEITQGDTYNDAGASAVDNNDGNINVTIAGAVNTETIGSYVLNYTASDQVGNTATVTRTIIVKRKITINSSKLRDCINNKFGYYPFQSTLRSIQTFICKNKHLDNNDIVELSQLNTLIELDISKNDVDDLTPLSKLVQLNTLKINENKIINIEPLRNLVQLSKLYLSDNKIVNISAIANLKNLTQLDIGYNEIHDLSNISELTQLNFLSIWFNCISDFTPTSHIATIVGGHAQDSSCIIVNTQITHKGIVYDTVTSPYTQRIWLDRNLGASQVCISHDDPLCYGDYYQWGRRTDGHEQEDSLTRKKPLETVLTSTSNQFIVGSSDWLSTDNNGSARVKEWEKTDGSSICPSSYRVPTLNELKAETVDQGANSNIAAFNNFLKIPSAGYRGIYGIRFSITEKSSKAYLWSNSLTNNSAFHLQFNPNFGFYNTRSFGEPVRCIKEN